MRALNPGAQDAESPVETEDTASVVVGAPGATVRLWVVLTAVLAAQTVLVWPRMTRFIWFAFGDPGCNLALVALVRKGARPMVEFGYNYGLVSVLAGDLWSRAF